MLEQHPVPQNVTNFQFKLVGDMTLKQFGYLAGGAILAYIAYNLPIPVFFRLPIAAIFALGGFGFAFVPIEERPMDVWFVSFIKSIYSPTLYVWQKEEPIIQLPQSTTQKKISSSFSLFLFVSQRKPFMLKNPIMYFSSLLSKKNINTQKDTRLNNIQNQNVLQNKTNVSLPPKQDNQKQPKFSQELKTTYAINANVENEKDSPTNKKANTLNQNNKQKNQLDEKQKQSSIHPNILHGFVKQRNGDIIQNILITVKNSENIPVRALKTDKSGKFSSPTPLPNGSYTIEAEDPKGSFFFEQTTIMLQGNAIKPIIIYAKSKQDLDRQRLEEILFGKKQK